MRTWIAAVMCSLALLLLPMRAHAALACTVSATTMNFGTISTIPVPQTDVAPNNGSISCSGGTANAAVRLCVGIDAGSGTGSTIANRIMNSGANTIQYQIYFNSVRTTVWGNSSNAGQQEIDVTLDGSGAFSGSYTMYGRIPNPPAQSASAGSYSSTLNVTAKIPSGNSPCANDTGTSQTGGSFAAQVVINSTCTITPTGVNFGSFTALSSTQNTSSSISVTCTNNAPYTIAMDAGTSTGNTIAARKMALGGVGAGVVTYQLYRDSGPTNIWGDGTTGVVYSGTGSGSAQTVPYYAQMPSQTTPAAGTYSDKVTATITF
jgi:spore coat protein U-like protein